MTSRVIFLLAILVAPVAPASAEDIVLNDGTTFKDATIVQHNAATATILDDNGGASVPISWLPDALQKKLHYDPAAAQKQLDSDAAAEAQQQALLARTHVLDAAALKVWGRIVQVRPDGFVAEFQTVDKCAQLIPVTRTTPVETLPTGMGRGDVLQTTVVGYRHAKVSLGKVFIEGDTTGLIDQAHWRGIVWPVGTYSYVTDDGRHTTIAAYTTSADKAYPILAQAAAPPAK